MFPRPPRLRTLVLAALALLSMPLGETGYRYAVANVHAVEPGVLQRSGPLSIVDGHVPWLGSKTVAMDRAFVEFADYGKNERRQLVAAL